MGLLDFLLPGVGTIVGGIAGAIGGHMQKGREQEAQRRAQLINRYSPLSGQRAQEVVPQTSTLGSALGGAFKGAQAGMGLSRLNAGTELIDETQGLGQGAFNVATDKTFTNKLQGAIIKAVEKGDMSAARRLDSLVGGGMLARVDGTAFGNDPYSQAVNNIFGGY